MATKPKTAPISATAPEPLEIQSAEHRLHIRYVDVALILPLEKNFKRHAIPETQKSLRRFGVIDPIGINRQTGKNYDGNGRVEALQAMREDWIDAGKPLGTGSVFEPPKGVVAVGEKWFVPTVDGVNLSEVDEAPAAAALNRINELGGYDEALMAEILQMMKDTPGSLDATGYSDEDVDEIVKRLEKEVPGGDFDIHEETPGGFGGGMQAHAAISNTKQIALILSQEVHAEFIELAMKLSERFKTDNVTDTVIACMRELGGKKK